MAVKDLTDTSYVMLCYLAIHFYMKFYIGQVTTAAPLTSSEHQNYWFFARTLYFCTNFVPDIGINFVFKILIDNNLGASNQWTNLMMVCRLQFVIVFCMGKVNVNHKLYFYLFLSICFHFFWIVVDVLDRFNLSL